MNRILVALDGSPRGPAVLATAVDLAKKANAKLVLYRAVGIPAEMPPDLWRHPEATLLDVLRDNAEKYLDKCAAEVPAELLEGKRVGVGAPWQAVCDEAEREHFDLFVIGSHGYRGLDRVLGTTAAKIVNHAPCSVYVVRPKS
jgi:nucleotide-binding universal stress UspA family protein